MRLHAADAAHPHGTVVPPGLPENDPDVAEGSTAIAPADDAPLVRCPLDGPPRPRRSDFRRVDGQRQRADSRLLARRQVGNSA